MERVRGEGGRGFLAREDDGRAEHVAPVARVGLVEEVTLHLVLIVVNFVFSGLQETNILG